MTDPVSEEARPERGAGTPRGQEISSPTVGELSPSDPDTRTAVRCRVCGSWCTADNSVRDRIGPKCRARNG